ncbi:MAG: hypothetical protein R3261_06300, partial [Alphaproteobacteria bacterium]|nr:hypothetical protein [Alphaproteobacteria bacterium]
MTPPNLPATENGEKYNQHMPDAKAVSFDLHYHTNIYKQSKDRRRQRLAQHRHFLQETNVDYVASTEHGYKGPLDAYLYLRDATEGIHTTILPAVEAISKEGVDIIFIFRNEDDLRNGLKSLTPFQWSANDCNKIRDAIGAINVIPHPFTPGKTGFANNMGKQSFIHIQEEVDYIEIHNGLSLHFLENGIRNKKMIAPGGLKQKVNYTFRLPNDLRNPNTGWAIS